MPTTTIDKITLVSEEAKVTDSKVHHVDHWQVYFSGGFRSCVILNTAATTGSLTLPKNNDTHRDDPSAYVSDIQVRLADGEGACGGTNETGIADYLVTYSQKDAHFDPSPTNRAPVITWQGTELVEVSQYTVDSPPKKIANSSGEMYANVPERPVRGAAQVTIERNELANPGSNVTTYSNTMNSSAWYGVGSNKARIGIIQAKQVTEAVNGTNLTYWNVSYPIHLNKNGWRLRMVDCGFCRLNYLTTPPTQEKIRDSMNHSPTTPVYLDGSGSVLDATNTTPVMFPPEGYKTMDETNFDDLHLPNPFA
jgi:hypothetical protein